MRSNWRIAIVTLAVMAAGLVPVQADDTDAARGSNRMNVGVPSATAAQTTAPISDSELEEMLMNQEKQLWEAMKVRDLAAIRKFMGEDGVFVSISGRVNDVEVLASPTSRMKFDPNFGETKVFRRLGPDAAILTFEINSRPEFFQTFLIVSSTYVRRGDRWEAIHHHMTYPPPPAPQPEWRR